MLGSEKEFVITKAQTHGPGHGAVYQWSEPSVIPLSLFRRPAIVINITNNFWAVAQLVEQSLSTPEVRGSNPVIGKLVCFYLFTFNCIEETVRPWMAHKKLFYSSHWSVSCCAHVWIWKCFMSSGIKIVLKMKLFLFKTTWNNSLINTWKEKSSLVGVLVNISWNSYNVWNEICWDMA